MRALPLHVRTCYQVGMRFFPLLGSYRSFEELARRAPEGSTWSRALVARASPFLIAAPHGGGIEPGTTELAQAVAGDDFALYSLLGTRPRGNLRLHLPSHRFDDPAFIDAAGRARVVVALHGCEGSESIASVGGLHIELGERILSALQAAGFDAAPDATDHSGKDPRNLCNQGRDGRGVQLELSRALRRSMFQGLTVLERHRTREPFARFVDALRGVLLIAARELEQEGDLAAHEREP